MSDFVKDLLAVLCIRMSFIDPIIPWKSLFQMFYCLIELFVINVDRTELNGGRLNQGSST